VSPPAVRRSRLRSPLARRLIVAIVLFSSLITLVLTALQLYGEYRRDVRGIEADLAQVEQVHLKTLAQSLWATNTKDLTLQLEGLVQTPNFAYVAVTDEQRTWAEAGARNARSTLERHYPMTYRHRDREHRIGTLTVVATLDAVYRHILTQAVVILASNGFKTFLVAGFMFAFFHWLVNRHLLTATDYVRSMNPETASAPLALDRPPQRAPDELDELAAAINRMHEGMHGALAALARSEETQRLSAAQTQQEHARMVSLLSAMSIGILFEDRGKRVLYHNPAFRRIWLIPDDVDLTGCETREVLRYSANVLARPDHFSRHILEVLATHEVSETFEIVMADGRVVTQISYPVRDPDGRFIGRLWIYEDVTRERQTAEQLIYLAERDSLSGLYNRHRFQEELGRMLVEAERHNRRGALLFFDLDEFKYINDNFGHRAGDAMLIRVAGEVGALVRRHEILARLGGDEFAVLVPDATEDSAARLAERIIRAVSQIPFRFEGQNLRLTTSLGIAMYPEHGANPEDLIAHADTAMYQAKEAGKNAWRVYRADLDSAREMLGRLTWQERIASALDQGLFQLHFQGVYHAADRRLSHLEALVRMRDEANPAEVIMPGHFIAVAEKTGQVVSIDRWVIQEAARRLAGAQDLPAIAVNISGRSIDDPLMPQFIADTLRAAGVAPQRLIVELTETAAVADLHDAQRFIEALHAAGSRVCLDDFGTGFASFAYLKYLRAEVLKIDGLFVRNLPNDHDNQVFVKSIVDVARGLRKQTIAEFVEDAETLELLRHFGVNMVQGYHLDMPRAVHPALDAPAG
jgi:diguanylate cyclase (GGDEF)-like protein